MVFGLFKRGVVKVVHAYGQIQAMHTITLDLQVVYNALKTNTSLTVFSTDVPYDFADVEMIESVLENHNSTLLYVQLNCRPRRTTQWDNANYYTDLIKRNRKPLCSATLTHCQFISVLSKVVGEHADLPQHELERRTYDSGSEPMVEWEERVGEARIKLKNKELGLLYGSLLDSVGFWSVGSTFVLPV